MQLARARSQLLPAGQQLSDGKEDVFALEAPGSKRDDGEDRGDVVGKGSESSDAVGVSGEGGEVAHERKDKDTERS